MKLGLIALAIFSVGISVALGIAMNKMWKYRERLCEMRSKYHALLSFAVDEKKKYKVQEFLCNYVVVALDSENAIMVWSKPYEGDDRDYVRLCAEEVCNHLNEEI